MLSDYTQPKAPDVYLPEKQKDEEWYLRSMRAKLSLFYQQSTTDVFGDPQNLIQDILSLYKYYFGKQDNVDFKFMEEIVPGVNTSATWLPGQKIASLLDYMKGEFIKMIQTFKPTANAISEERVKTKQKIFDQAALEMELRPMFQQAQQMTGIPFQPIQGLKPQSQMDIERYKNYGVKEYAEEAAQIIGKHTFYANYYKEILPRVALDGMITGYGGLDIYAENGHVKWNYIHPINAIIDVTPNSDVNRNASYGGYHDWLSIPEVLKKYNLTEEQKQKLKDLSNNNKEQSKLNVLDNFTWWRTVQGQHYVRVVHLRWKDVKIMSYESGTDKAGQPHLSRSRRKKLNQREIEEKGKTLYKREVETVRQATLIADTFMVDYGERNNQARGYQHLADTDIGIIFYTPGMILGVLGGIVRRLRQHQDRIDSYRYKIQQAISQDKGKVYTFDYSQLPQGYDATDVMVELQTNGIIGYDSTRSEDGTRPPSGKYIDVINLTIDDKTVNAYLMLIAQEKREMEEVVNIPQIAQGLQTGIVGKGVQENTIAQSTIGTLHYFDAFHSFTNRVIQYSTNLAKILYTMEDSYEGVFVTGDKGSAFLKVTKDFLLEDFTIYMDTQDSLDDTKKNRLLTIAQAQAQNGLIDMLDYVKMEKMDSYNETERYLEYSLEKKKQEQQQAAQQEHEQQMQQIQAQGQAQQQTQMAAQYAENQRTKMKADTALQQTVIREGSKLAQHRSGNNHDFNMAHLNNAFAMLQQQNAAEEAPENDS